MKRKINPDDSFVEYICDQLAAIDGIAHRPMFGGYGLYCGSTFFGIVYRGGLYFKTSDDTRKQYIDWGTEPFQPNAKQRLKAYYEVPPDQIETPDDLTKLADQAIEVAMTSAK